MSPQRRKRSKRMVSIPFANKLMVPKEFSIYERDGGDTIVYEQSIDFIENISKIDLNNSYVIDFSKTIRLTAAALVVLYATIEQVKERGTFKATIVWPNSESVKKILMRSGMSELLRNIPPNRYNSHNSNKTIISGVGSEGFEELIDKIEKNVYREQMSDEIEFLYGDAISEALNNVGRHAYPNIDDEKRKWWLLCDVIGEKLYVLIYDAGVGIPKTVVQRNWFVKSVEEFYPEQYESAKENSQNKLLFFKLLKDENLIDLAMKQDVTGTLKRKHGQGSKSIKALIGETEGGKLWIYSNNGLLTFKSEDEPVGLHSLNRKFPGTLVQWNIKIS